MVSRPVAVKQVARLFKDTVDCKRILREIAIMSRLDHPGIVKLYDVPTVTDIASFDEVYMVMELCDTDMAKLMNTGVALNPIHTTTLTYNLLLGLRYLHSVGIYHRDLKPANCLCNADCSVKICDFGLARTSVFEEDEPTSPVSVKDTALDDDAPPPPRSIKRQLTHHVATRWYRAPELILLQENYTQAVDMWSVGCILAELVGTHRDAPNDKKGPLFPGSSCFPLSPNHQAPSDWRFHTLEDHDQLNMIFSLLGTPSAEDQAFVERPDAQQYLRFFAPRLGAGLRGGRFSHVSDAIMTLLEGTLCFAPNKRLTAEDLLASPTFDEVRDPALEDAAETPAPIRLKFEKAGKIDELLLRTHFVKEIAAFRAAHVSPRGSPNGNTTLTLQEQPSRSGKVEASVARDVTANPDRGVAALGA